MAYVIDTHAMVWFLTKNKKLGKNALKILKLADDDKARIIIPTIVLAEIFYICEKKKVSLAFERVLRKMEDGSNYIVYDLDFDVILKLKELNKIGELHDRIIVATALLTNSKVLTKDEDIIDSDYIETIW